jgi:hypothetical protein
MTFSQWLQLGARRCEEATKNIFMRETASFRYALPYFGYDVPLLRERPSPLCRTIRMRLTVSAIATLSLMAQAAAAAPAACPIEKTVYRLNGYEKSATLRFVDDPALARQTHLSALIHSTITGKTYRYTLAVSNGYSNHYLVDASGVKPKDNDEAPETREDTPTFSFFSFDKRLRKIDLPDRRKQGPAYVFIPDLGTSLWYSEIAPDQKTREAIETEMWKRAECVK